MSENHNATFDFGIFDEGIFDASRWIPSNPADIGVWSPEAASSPTWNDAGATASTWTPINPT